MKKESRCVDDSEQNVTTTDELTNLSKKEGWEREKFTKKENYLAKANGNHI